MRFGTTRTCCEPAQGNSGSDLGILNMHCFSLSAEKKPLRCGHTLGADSGPGIRKSRFQTEPQSLPPRGGSGGGGLTFICPSCSVGQGASASPFFQETSRDDGNGCKPSLTFLTSSVMPSFNLPGDTQHLGCRKHLIHGHGHVTNQQQVSVILPSAPDQPTSSLMQRPWLAAPQLWEQLHQWLWLRSKQPLRKTEIYNSPLF